MSSNLLLDILPTGREVAVGRGKVNVVGVSLSYIGVIINRLPQLRERIDAGTASFAQALTAVPEAVPMFLAAGVGKAGDAEAEGILGQLPMFDQIALLNEVLIETKGGENRPLATVVKAVAKTLGINPDAVDHLLDNLAKIDLAAPEASPDSSTTLQ
jgi:hypothetical protein